MTAVPDDAALLARVVDGDREAFGVLMRRHEDRVFAVCLRLMGNRSGALDASQETFLTLYRKAGQYRAKAAVGTWLYRIAVNTCYDLLRKEKRRPTEPIPDYLDPEDRSAGDPYASVELRPSIEEALAELSPEFRSVVLLADVHGLSMPEVADALEIPVGTVKSRLFRARRHLATSLGNLSSDSEHQRPTDP